MTEEELAGLDRLFNGWRCDQTPALMQQGGTVLVAEVKRLRAENDEIRRDLEMERRTRIRNESPSGYREGDNDW